jgi:ATP-dependent RNA helicase DeaD
MSGFVELHLEQAIGAVLESFGYADSDPAVRDQAPTAARGHNLVLACPPAARYAVPTLAGFVSSIAREQRPGLILAPSAALTEWSAVLRPLAEAAGITFLASELPARATRLCREGRLKLLLTTPGTALALQQRSALKLDQVGHLMLVWPELYPDEEPIAALMQDLPQESQRIIVPVSHRPAHPLAERYARRAHVTGPLLTSAPPVGEARGAIVAWPHRATAIASLLESEDPARLVVWCADAQSVLEARASLPVTGDTITVLTGESPAADLIVAWDLPTPSQLAELQQQGKVILLIPPHAGSYVSSLTTRLTPVRIRGTLEGARDRIRRQCEMIEELVRQGGLDSDLIALAPLFERYDPTAVAAAAYRLWQAAPVAAAAAATGAAAPGPRRNAAGVARIWIGVGRKDGAGPNDIVAALTREAGVEAASIGRIEIREMFSLVEVPAADAEEIAQKIAGRTIRRRTVNARVDRGGGGERPGPRGASPRVRRPTS